MVNLPETKLIKKTDFPLKAMDFWYVWVVGEQKGFDFLDPEVLFVKVTRYKEDSVSTFKAKGTTWQSGAKLPYVALIESQQP